MKNIVKIIFCLLFTTQAFAQVSTEESFQEYWLYSYCYYLDSSPTGISDPGGDNEVFCDGEKDKNGKTYNLVYHVKGHLPQIPSMVDTLLYRSEGSRVYADLESMCNAFYDGDSEGLLDDYSIVDGEVLLYDFSLTAGDSFGRTSVSEVSDVVFGNKERKLIVLANGHRLLEGIGSLNGGFFEYMKTPLWKPGYEGIITTYLRLYEEEGEIVFQQNNEEAYESLLHDVQGINEMDFKHAGQYGSFYDLQGRRLSTRPAKGVYIQNGKKYVR